MRITDTSFQTSEVKKGDFVHNMTDDVYSVVKSVDSPTTTTFRKPNIFDLLWHAFKYWMRLKQLWIKTFPKRIRWILGKK